MKRLSTREATQPEKVPTVYIRLDPGATRIHVADDEGIVVPKFSQTIGNRARAYLYARSVYNYISKALGYKIASLLETPQKASFNPSGFPSKSEFPEQVTTESMRKVLAEDIHYKVADGKSLNEAFREVADSYGLTSEDEQAIVKLLMEVDQ